MSDIKVRVGQQNSVKVISSISGGSAFADLADIAKNVIGGIASVTSLNVSGLSTFVGVGTFFGDLYVGGDLYVADDIVFDELTARNINLTGIGTISTLDTTNGTIDFLSNTNLNTSGIGTISTLDTTNGTIDYLNGTNVFYSGIATLGVTSISQIYVSGISTFVGVATFKNNVYIDGDLYVGDDLVFDEFTSRNGNITGILTVGQSFYYPPGQPYGIAYFDPNDQLVSTGTTATAISETNYILTTDNSGIPTWSSVIDGGTY